MTERLRSSIISKDGGFIIEDEADAPLHLSPKQLQSWTSPKMGIFTPRGGLKS